MSYFGNSGGIDEWYVRRRATFSSSKNYKLLGTPLAYDNYVEEKVVELSTRIFERPELEEVKSLLWGNVHEMPAAERYIQETKNYDISYIGRDNPIFFPNKRMPEECGGSPDMAHIIDGPFGSTIDFGAEIKCPINPAVHFKRLDWKSQWDIKEKYLSCYTQIQDLMRHTGALQWDFISYDERQMSKSKRIKIIEVKPDQNFIDNLEIKTINAVRDKYKLLSKYMGEEIKNKSEFLAFARRN